MSLGIEVQDGSMKKILKRNTSIPTRKTWNENSEVRNATRIHINIFEGERLLHSENNNLGDFLLNTTKGKVSMCQVTFEVDTNGILTVSAKESITGHVNLIQIKRDARTLSKKRSRRNAKESKSL